MFIACPKIVPFIFLFYYFFHNVVLILGDLFIKLVSYPNLFFRYYYATCYFLRISIWYLYNPRKMFTLK